jgi:hypothetical protein
MQKADGEEKLRMVKDSRLVPVVQASAIKRVSRQQVNSAHNHRAQSYDCHSGPSELVQYSSSLIGGVHIGARALPVI